LLTRLFCARCQLESPNPDEVAAAAEFLFERAHTSHMRSMENKEQMRRDGAIPVLFKALDSESRDARYHACSALSELAFRNELNCMAIAQSEDGLETIVELLIGDDSALKEDALLVVNNCAAFCVDVCTAIVSCPGMLDALKALVQTNAAGVSSVAVGAINCLSRCEEVREVLLDVGMLETLIPVVKVAGVGDRHEAHVARATMAIANLTMGKCEGVFDRDDDRKVALGTTVKILSHSLKGENWAGIHFAPYSVIFPLCNLALTDENKEMLLECGLAEQLSTLIKEWRGVGHQSEQTLELAVQIAQSLSGSQESQRCMRSAGMMAALDDVAAGKHTQNVRVQLQAAHIVKKMTEGHLAFFMGHQNRLGENSPLFQLDDLTMSKIAHMVFGCAEITPLNVQVVKEQDAPDTCCPNKEDQRIRVLNAALSRMQHINQVHGGLRRIPATGRLAM
jgi:hypothetical protein